MARNEETVVLGGQGRLVIPAHVRREMGLREGDRLTLRRDGDHLALSPQRAEVQAAQGMYRHLAGDGGVVDELIAERRAEARREQDA